MESIAGLIMSSAKCIGGQSAFPLIKVQLECRLYFHEAINSWHTNSRTVTLSTLK